MLPGLEVCRWEGDGEGRGGGQLGEKVGELGGGYREEIEMTARRLQSVTFSPRPHGLLLRVDLWLQRERLRLGLLLGGLSVSVLLPVKPADGEGGDEFQFWLSYLKTHRGVFGQLGLCQVQRRSGH